MTQYDTFNVQQTIDDSQHPELSLLYGIKEKIYQKLKLKIN